MQTKLITENKIENYKVELHSNNLKNAYQLIKITNSVSGDCRKSNIVAPVDFYAITTAIVYAETIDEFIENISGCWCSDAVESMIDELENEFALKVSDAEINAEKELSESFDVYFDDE